MNNIKNNYIGIWSKVDIACSIHDSVVCVDNGGSCNIQLDGYTVQTGICLFIGIVWVLIFQSKLNDLQSLSFNDWMISKQMSIPIVDDHHRTE